MQFYEYFADTRDRFALHNVCARRAVGTGLNSLQSFPESELTDCQALLPRQTERRSQQAIKLQQCGYTHTHIQMWVCWPAKPMIVDKTRLALFLLSLAAYPKPHATRCLHPASDKLIGHFGQLRRQLATSRPRRGGKACGLAWGKVQGVSEALPRQRANTFVERNRPGRAHTLADAVQQFAARCKFHSAANSLTQWHSLPQAEAAWSCLLHAAVHRDCGPGYTIPMNPPR